MIKTLIFDIGGVVVDDRLKELFTRFANRVNISAEFFIEYNKIYKDKLLLGEISLKEFWDVVVKAGADPKLDLQKIWLEEALQICKLNIELLELIKKLRKNYSVGTLTNLSDSRLIIDDAQNLYDNFDYAVKSCVDHLIKPDPAIYKLALERSGFTADEAVFIDDREHFILAAKELNIHCVHFQNNTQLKKELVQLGVKLD